MRLQGNCAPNVAITLAPFGRLLNVPRTGEKPVLLTSMSTVPGAGAKPRVIPNGKPDASANVRVSLFQMRLENEIYFTPLVPPFGNNVNLSPTEREGLEIGSNWSISPRLDLFAKQIYESIGGILRRRVSAPSGQRIVSRVVIVKARRP